MSTYRGLPACTCLAVWLPAFERAIGREVRLFQLVGDAKASAGFHRGGGSADCEPLSRDELRIARNMGGAAFNRPWEDNEHCHIRLNGCPHNTIAQPQVTDLNEGRDGTGPLYDNAGVPDNGPRDGVHWPLRTWREGIEWANQQEEDEMTPEQEERLAKGFTAAVAASEKRIDARVQRNTLAIVALIKANAAGDDADVERIIAAIKADD